ncbi:MAG: yejE [Planctomycetaceae bacterium]|nr:yejE [Planctomycetaceae bacterium]
MTADKETTLPATPARGYWAEVWRQFRKRRLSVIALWYIGFLSVVAVAAPLIAGTKPIVCRFEGKIYFPCLSYYNRGWEPGIFTKGKFRKEYSTKLKIMDPESWAVWPLIYQDPYRRVRDGEWPGQPGNPSGADGVPSRFNLLGTDQQGKDVFAQLVHGTTLALLVGFVSMGIAATIGIIVGALGGYFGGWVDMITSRITEVVMCIPTLILILAMIAILEQTTIWHMMAIIGITSWTSIARLTRGEFLKLRDAEFVNAARAIGVGEIRIMYRYILPNALAPILVPVTFGIASAILIETSLSFLGVGLQPPNPSWGTLLDSGRNNLALWWLIFFPGTAVFSAVLAYNLIGDGLLEATDPRLREGR